MNLSRFSFCLICWKRPVKSRQDLQTCISCREQSVFYSGLQRCNSVQGTGQRFPVTTLIYRCNESTKTCETIPRFKGGERERGVYICCCTICAADSSANAPDCAYRQSFEVYLTCDQGYYSCQEYEVSHGGYLSPAKSLENEKGTRAVFCWVAVPVTFGDIFNAWISFLGQKFRAFISLN